MPNDYAQHQFLRRELLAGAAYLILGRSQSGAATISDHLPWTPNARNPPDSVTPGGKDASCAVFVDRQLAGPYGRQDGLYVRPPFMAGAQHQGHQSETSPAQDYREGLAALDKRCKAQMGGKAFYELSDVDKDHHSDRAGGQRCASTERRSLDRLLKIFRWAFLPIRFMAVIGTWSLGK
jgi:gluconate 2-dehydrogenase gamma chain